MKDQGIEEEEFFGFAKPYLSEAFPNPQRIDYPLDSEFTRFTWKPGRPEREESDSTSASGW